VLTYGLRDVCQKRTVIIAFGRCRSGPAQKMTRFSPRGWVIPAAPYHSDFDRKREVAPLLRHRHPLPPSPVCSKRASSRESRAKCLELLGKVCDPPMKRMKEKYPANVSLFFPCAAFFQHFLKTPRLSPWPHNFFRIAN